MRYLIDLRKNSIAKGDLMNTITKELLSAVLGEEYKPRMVDIIRIEDNVLSTYYDCGKFDENGDPTGLGYELNIYELAHKCKEWAVTKDMYIETRLVSSNSLARCVVWFDGDNDVYWNDDDELEPYAIFKACQWMLNNKKES